MTTRQPWLLLFALIALCGSLTTVFATASLRDFNLRGYVDATQTADLPFRIPRLGVNVELTQYSADQLPHQFDLMQQAHIHWLRQPVRWDQIETQPGQYNWTQWDSIIAALEAYPDLKIVAVLVNS
ncbi:MAG: beta-galactosidase, partial [Anaerolineae bacterium]|nr:beta-galactosidase [Anaerolineae bacterium]